MHHFFKWKFWFQYPRLLKYKLLSDNKNLTGRPICNQPVLFAGKGTIRIGTFVHLGYFPSPFFYNGYIHIEARQPDAVIEIGNNVYINNNFFAISDSAGIKIGNNVLIGINCEIVDSDFHFLAKEERWIPEGAKGKKVVLEDNVFLGNNVRILKGVSLGKNVVVANNAVVTESFGDDLIIGGIPAKIIGKL